MQLKTQEHFKETFEQKIQLKHTRKKKKQYIIIIMKFNFFLCLTKMA